MSRVRQSARDPKAPPSGIASPGDPLQGLPPVVSPATRLLVLGSFPGARSLADRQYYAHPRNQFWRILSALWSEDLVALHYAGRLERLHAHRLGLWDVYAACERQGSLDAAIRRPVVNDFAALARYCPLLEAVAHNGAESFRHARHSATLARSVHRLPSTSPAHAAWSFEQKCDAWADVFRQHRLLR